MKRIIILGSKPGAKLAEGDAIFCANASFQSDLDRILNFRYRAVVASAFVLAKGFRKDISSDDAYRNKFLAVKEFDADAIFLFAHAGKVNYVKDVLDKLSWNHDKVNILSVRERILLTLSVGKVKYPVIDQSFRSQTLKVQALDTVKILIFKFLWKLGSRTKDVRAKYRPSTGILALLIAISKYGPEHEYIMCGIGLSNRNLYLVNKRYFSIKRKLSDGLPIHVNADRLILKSLVRFYKLSSTDEETSEFLDGIRQA